MCPSLLQNTTYSTVETALKLSLTAETLLSLKIHEDYDQKYNSFLSYDVVSGVKTDPIDCLVVSLTSL